MKSFKQFLKEDEHTENKLGLSVDNPGGDWEKRKQRDAAKDMRDHKGRDTFRSTGLHGSVTGAFKKHPHIPVDHIKDLPGAMGEHKHKHLSSSGKMKDLEKEVGHPSKFDSKKHPIFIGVNHRGHGHVLEGNHRLEYARKHGISHIHAEVRYFNGGERAKGKLHPKKLEKLHKDED